MSQLLNLPPYGPRNDELFLKEMNELGFYHRKNCPEYSKMTKQEESPSIEKLPFLHVGLFKHLHLKSFTGTDNARMVQSSATSGQPSQVSIDAESGRLQKISSNQILEHFLGSNKRPLLILDSSKSLRSRGALSARVMAAMSLSSLSSDIFFLLPDANDQASLDIKQLLCALNKSDEFLVYGFSWMLWLAWAESKLPQEVLEIVKTKRLRFVHSGGWKKLADRQVSPEVFTAGLLDQAGPASDVLDFYGLVEQIGIIYPECAHGFRHVPVWADVRIRSSYTLESLVDEPGQIQLMNTISLGSPNHNVLTEDLGIIYSGDCSCGRSGKRFKLLGRIPKAEIRGCANVG